MGTKSMYVAVWAVLVFATFLEVATRTVSAAAIATAIGIIIISITKGLLIASVYQHLWHEGKVLAMLPGIALIALTLLLVTSVMGVM